MPADRLPAELNAPCDSGCHLLSLLGRGLLWQCCPLTLGGESSSLSEESLGLEGSLSGVWHLCLINACLGEAAAIRGRGHPGIRTSLSQSSFLFGVLMNSGLFNSSIPVGCEGIGAR